MVQAGAPAMEDTARAPARDGSHRLGLALAVLLALAACLPTVRWIASDNPAHETEPHTFSSRNGSGGELPRARSCDVAFLQYTSGSTAAPKGAEITHGALVANLEVIGAMFALGPQSRGVFWLPLYHDMGLVGGVLGTVASGGTSTLMSPLVFLQRPLRWLREIARTRATVSGGPNFAFDLCVRKTTPAERAELDLSSWQLAFNGAEPVRAETLERFAAAFAPAGFRRDALYPCYGLAEATLFVAGDRWSGQLGAVGAIGAVAPGHEVVIIDADRSPRQEGELGEICVRGPSIARGYWGRPEESAATFGLVLADGCGPWLRTGDLGFVRDGALHVTGRLKDLVIVHGRNHYPQDLERAAEAAHSAVRPGCTGAFAIELGGEEGVVVVAELDPSREHEREAVRASIVRSLIECAEVRPHRVVLVRHGTIPKTSSGKIQRHACRDGFRAGTLEVLS